MPREKNGRKVCSKCRKEKDVSEFQKILKSVDGLYYSCKSCEKAHKDSRREHIRELDKKSYLKNQKRRVAKSMKYNYLKKGLSVPERILGFLAQFKKKPANKEDSRNNEMARLRNWKASNKDKVVRSNFLYSQTDDGRENNRLKSQRRRARKNLLPNSLTKEDVLFLLEFQEGKCGFCQRPFSKNLPYEVDHVVPVVMGGGFTLENSQLLCRSCNASKNSKAIRYIPELPIEILNKEVFQ